MENTKFCMWSGGRRPVQAKGPLGLADRQGQIPPGWCDCCGAEVYRPGNRYCFRCCRLGLAGRSMCR